MNVDSPCCHSTTSGAEVKFTIRSHGGGNIKQVLKLLVWSFCKNKGCKKLKYNNPTVVQAVKTNMALKTFLNKIGDKKIRTVSAIGKVGAGVLPAQIFVVKFFELFRTCFWWATGSGQHRDELESAHGRSSKTAEVRGMPWIVYSQKRYLTTVDLSTNFEFQRVLLISYIFDLVNMGKSCVAIYGNLICFVEFALAGGR